jgi:exopolysaccharide biosynthesis protein
MGGYTSHRKSGMRWLNAGVFIALSALLGAWSSARAEDTWTSPAPGLVHLHRVEGRIDVHALFVDLHATHLSLVSTRQQDRGLSVTEFAKRYGADIAINANYFHWDMRSCGLAAGDGLPWTDSYTSGCVMTFGFGRYGRAAAFDSSFLAKGPLPWTWMSDAVTGKPWIIRNGLIPWSVRNPRHMSGRHPRTALGLTRDRSTLIVLVADGRRKGVPGLNGRELAYLMESLGAHNAVNLDGGGSSLLYVAQEGGVQNQPSDGRPRPVANHLGIRLGIRLDSRLSRRR